jgi:hypothetical protein
MYWRESLICCEKIHRAYLHFVGPGIDVKRQKETTQWRMGGGCETGREIECEVIGSGKRLFHEHPDAVKLLLQHDLFVLFNPGFGCEALKESWKPTLSLLLQSRKTVLCTALSEIDMKRDLDALKQLSAEEDYQELGEPLDLLIQPTKNPFRSEKRQYDALEVEGNRVLVVNEYIYAFQAK